MIPNRSRILTVGGWGTQRLAVFLFAILVTAHSAWSQGIADAATVPPAAIVDRPLNPAANDVPDAQPSALHVWIPGHWRWSEGAYVWVAGDWEIPPVANAIWIAPKWEPRGNGFVLREGHWRLAEPIASQNSEPSTTQPPPPPRHELIPGRPAPGYVWLAGFWDYRDGRFDWVDGRWELPPQRGQTWVPARWEARGDRFHLVRGYWRDLPSVTVPQPPPMPPAPHPVVVSQPTPPPQVIVMAPPPAARPEVVYERPSPQHVWVPGFWAWRDGRHVWISGHWERPPRGRAIWIEPRWEDRSGRWVFVDGHWR